jgi:hypothetical protein
MSSTIQTLHGAPTNRNALYQPQSGQRLAINLVNLDKAHDTKGLPATDLAFFVSVHWSYLEHSKRLGKRFAEDLLLAGVKPQCGFLVLRCSDDSEPLAWALLKGRRLHRRYGYHSQVALRRQLVDLQTLGQGFAYLT